MALQAVLRFAPGLHRKFETRVEESRILRTYHKRGGLIAAPFGFG